MENNKLCDYGCNQEAKFLLKNGKNCCSEHFQSCPEIKRKNGASKIGINPFEGKEHPRGFKGKTPWNKGKETSEETKNKISISLKGNSKGIALTEEKEEERKRKISETMKKNKKSGGKRHGSGRGKKGWYKGFFCDSSWELAYVIYNLEHDIKLIRNTEKFPYLWENEIHYYIPDFILEDGSYIEVKGYRTKQVEEKIKQFKYPLEIIDKHNIKAYIKYVENKYGKNYIELYE